jgi:hypothetical protein
MSDFDINDIRTSHEFRTISFSQYKKTLVVKELLNSLTNSKVEEACNWSAELICAGHYSELWEIILKYVGKHIHLGNPKLPIYIDMRFDKFKDIMFNGYIGNELSMRNSTKIRKLFGEIISILCYSRKNLSFDPIKINKNEYDITNMTNKLKAPSIEYVNKYFKPEDPKELFIAINEFAYNLHNTVKNKVNACYWIEWIIEFESLCKQKKEKCLCETRTFPPVQDTYKNDIIWIIWEILLDLCNYTNNTLTIKIMESLLKIFSIKYKPGTKKKRKHLLYFAVSLITENVDYTIEMISNKKNVDVIVSKIDVIYKQIKKNEVSPQTDYLFNNVDKSTNLKKTIEKLEKMKNLTNPINMQKIMNNNVNMNNNMNNDNISDESDNDIKKIITNKK